MAKRPAPKPKTKSAISSQPNWIKLALALTLVPLVAGVVFIILWAIDIYLWEDSLAQALIGVLFILFSFAANNALQRRWVLASGWGLLGLADLLLLTTLDLRLQIPAIIAGFAGAGLILFEVARTMAKMGQENKS